MTNQIATDSNQSIAIGRYLLHRQIARGGMATIHIARLIGDEGFSRIVAAKRLHSEFAEDSEFVAMFLAEAHIASKVHHRNVVPVLDVVTSNHEVMLVQEYVHGVPLHWLLRTAYEAKTHVPINVAVSIACQVLTGLEAAHQAVDEVGTPLHIIHRDVSPQNIMIATDGTARLLDFGIAKAAVVANVTREGIFKGKLAYSAPEQIRSAATQQSDIYSLSVALWELLVGQRLHRNVQSEAELINEIMSGRTPTITEALEPQREWLGQNRWKQLQAIEPILQRGMAVDLGDRWATAAEMEAALATAVTPASQTGIAGWLKNLGRDFLAERDQVIASEEESWRRTSEHFPRHSSRMISTPPTRASTVTNTVQTELRWRPGALVTIGAAAVAASIAALVVWFGRGPVTDAPKSAAKPVEAHVAPNVPADTAPQADAAPQGTADAPNWGASHGGPIPIVRPPAQPTRRVRPASERASGSPSPASGNAPAATSDCNPPYYFEGQKKIFKPACL